MSQPSRQQGRCQARARGAAEVAETDAASAGARKDGDGSAVVRRSGRGKKLAVYVALVVFALIYVYPFIVQVSTSLKTDAAAVDNPLTLVPTRSPRPPSSGSPTPTSRCGSPTPSS